MTIPTPGATCEIAGCDRLVSAACDNCGQLCCTTHLAVLTLARRAVPQNDRREPLARLPVSTETYSLCPRCSKRPFAGKPSSSSGRRP